MFCVSTILALKRCRSLILFPSAFIAFPVKGPKISHGRYHRYIVPRFLEGLYHLTVKSFIKTAVGVNLHYIFGLGKFAGEICGRPLPDCFGKVRSEEHTSELQSQSNL